MLDWLEIRQLAVAEHLALEFGDGFTALTGETGSGKSLIVDALSVLLGARAEPSMIRANAAQAEIQGGFALHKSHAAADWLAANELGDECILRRVLRRDKPSRAFVNGRAVTAAQLRELGGKLVEIHGQNEHYALLGRRGQLALLDSAAGNAEALAELGAHYDALTGIRARMRAVQTQSETMQQRADLLRFQIGELQQLAPEEGEWEKLETRQKRMHHAKDLADGARQVAMRLNEEEGGNLRGNLEECIRALQRLLQYDARLQKVIAMLEEAAVNFGECTAQLQSMAGEGAPDAEEIRAVESRFSAYHELSRKHRALPGLLAKRLQELQAELTAAADPAAELQRLQDEWDARKKEYDRAAAVITGNRARAGKRLASQVSELMQGLGMGGGVFEIKLTESGDADGVSRRGLESVEFLVSANPGQPPQALTKVASGGELSRISLAINVALAQSAPTSTLIFDEVDAGIGGQVAEVVGLRLRALGAARQVICITHLSQVAAKARHHWSVAKRNTDAQTAVGVRGLAGDERIREIARMTSGAQLTPQSLAHAEQLLQSA